MHLIYEIECLFLSCRTDIVFSAASMTVSYDFQEFQTAKNTSASTQANGLLPYACIFEIADALQCGFEGCGLRFAHSSTCKDHERRTHTDERPFAVRSIWRCRSAPLIFQLNLFYFHSMHAFFSYPCFCFRKLDYPSTMSFDNILCGRHSRSSAAPRAAASASPPARTARNTSAHTRASDHSRFISINLFHLSLLHYILTPFPPL